MDIPVSSTLGFIGIVLFGFGLFLVLAGLDISPFNRFQFEKVLKHGGLGLG